MQHFLYSQEHTHEAMKIDSVDALVSLQLASNKQTTLTHGFLLQSLTLTTVRVLGCIYVY